jgi:N-methylhydantoinase A
VLAAAELAAQRSGTTLDELLPQVSRFGLGTTAVTNTLASRTGRLVGLLATSGFEEMIPIAQGTRIVDEDGWLSTPNILEHRTIAAIEERIDRNGDVVVPINLDQVKEAARRLVEDEGVEAIAVSFVWSFANRTHEDQAVAAVPSHLPRPSRGLGSGPASGHPRVRAHDVRRPERVRLGCVRRHRGARG